ncbi:hypothetical protein IGI04_036134, partial [Brassica rapa subsp. trilocularis]
RNSESRRLSNGLKQVWSKSTEKSTRWSKVNPVNSVPSRSTLDQIGIDLNQPVLLNRNQFQLDHLSNQPVDRVTELTHRVDSVDHRRRRRRVAAAYRKINSGDGGEAVDVPWIVDPSQDGAQVDPTKVSPSDEATMVEPEANFGRAGRSDTYLGELVELNQSDTYISELDELSELSDTSLELNELSDTEADPRKIHNKFNLGRFYTKFDQALLMVLCLFASRNINKRSQSRGHIKGHSTSHLFLPIIFVCRLVVNQHTTFVLRWLALDRGYIKSHSASLDDPFNPSQFQKCRLPSRIISNIQLKMFGLLKKSKPQQDVYFPFKTVFEKEQLIFDKKQFASNEFDFVQKQKKRQNRCDDEKWVRSGDRPFTKAKRSNRDVPDQNELQTYASLEKMLHKAIHVVRQLQKKGNTNTSSAPKQQSSSELILQFEMNSKKVLNKNEFSGPLNAFDIGAYDLGLGSFVSIQEGSDEEQYRATMVEPEANFGRAGRSDTYLGELVELNQSDTYISELDELSELSDTSLELNELSDTEDEAGLVAGRNGPFSAQRKIHNKFNLDRFYTKFYQVFADGLMPICIKKYQQKESKSWSYQGAFNNTLISIPEVPFAFSDHIQHPAKVILPILGFYQLVSEPLWLFWLESLLKRNPGGVVEEKPCWLKRNPALGQLRRIHIKISSLFFLFSFPTKMFGLLKKSKPQQDVYFPFKTIFEKEQLIFDKKQFASKEFDFVQKQKKRQNRCDDEKWFEMNSKKVLNKNEFSGPLNAFDIGAYDLGLGSFVSIQEGSDEEQYRATMVEPEANFGRAGRSDTYLGELVELNQSDTYISELDELSELSDTSLELNELSDTEDGAGLVAGRNGPFSAQRKIHNKFNLGRFYTKFDQVFADGLMPICIKKYQQKESKSWSYQGAFNNTLISSQKWLALDRGYIKSHSASLDDPFNPSQFQKCRLPSRIISNIQLKMFGLLKKSKPQQDVYFPFKTIFEKEQLIFDKKQFASKEFDFVQKQKKRQNRCDDEKWVKSGDRPFTKAKRSIRDVPDQNELQTYASLEKMLHKAIHVVRQLQKKGNTNTSSAPKQQSSSELILQFEMNSKKVLNKNEFSGPLNAFDIGAYDLGLGSFVSIQEGSDEEQYRATMVEPEANFGRAGRSDTYLGELVELNQSDTYISELDELSELSDTSLELNELSDTEDEAGLVAGRNGPFSAQRKIHNKFNLDRFYTKFYQVFADGLMPICIKKYQQKESKSWSYQGAFNNTLISSQKWLALDRGYIKSHSASLDDPFNPSQFQKCRLPSRIISNIQLK